MNPNQKPPAPTDDEATMQAIQKLESEDNLVEAPEPVAPPAQPAPEPAPVVVEPEPTAPQPTETPAEPVAEQPAAQAEPQPISTGFQPFPPPKKKSPALAIVLVVILVLAGLGVGGYYGWQYLQSLPANTVQSSAETTDVDTSEDQPVQEVDLEDNINSFESDLEELDSTDFQETTLSDDALLSE